ncbi:MAG: AmmeMemoRadiSam system protein B [Alphaproteobacteria bacterium]
MLSLKTTDKSFRLELFFIVFLLIITVAFWFVIFFPELLFKTQNQIETSKIEDRKPAVANLFYPANSDQLRKQINNLMKDAKIVNEQYPIKALIVPHSSLGYSGITAGTAYAQIKSLKNKIKKVVILAPATYSKFSGIALSPAAKWQMPFGSVTVDQPTNKALLDLPFVRMLASVHKNEHSIEIQLPFIYETLGSVTIVPAIFGETNIGEMDLFINKALKDDDTLLIVCSNLSTNLSYMEGKKADIATSKAILGYNIRNLDKAKASGYLAIQALLNYANQYGYAIKILDIKSSGDVDIRRDSVVGYASFAIYAPLVNPLVKEQQILNDITEKYGKTLVKIAFDSIINGIKTGKPLIVNPKDYPKELRSFGISFVSINKSGSIRGAMGSLTPKENILQDIATNAFFAAFYDNNFKPINKKELPFISVKISLLTPPYPLSFTNERELLDQIEPNIDGVIFQEKDKKLALLLPEVWSYIKDKKLFLNELKRQAGLDAYYWSSTITAGKFLTSTVDQENYPKLKKLWQEYGINPDS